MLREHDIAHAVTYRRHLIAGRNWEVKARDEGSPRAAVAIDVATNLLKHIKRFSDARVNLARAFFSGARFARIHGRPMTLRIGDGQLRTWWVPTRLEDLDKRVFRVVPHRDEHDNLSASWQQWHVGAGEWRTETVRDAVRTVRHVYQDDQGHLGYGRALREALGWLWYAKTHASDENLQAVERFAQGILKAKVAGIRDAGTNLPNTELIAKWVDALQNMMARNVLVHDSEDEVEHLQTNGEGWQLLDKTHDRLRSAVFTLVMGANLTTAAAEGGSYALAEVQQNSTEALIDFDRESQDETLTDDLVGCLWYENYANIVDLGLEDDAPLFTATQDKHDDPQVRAAVAKTLHEMGVNLSQSDVMEQTGFRVPEGGEIIIPGRAETAPGLLPGDVGGDLSLTGQGFRRRGWRQRLQLVGAR
jgi:hypothetical protein